MENPSVQQNHSGNISDVDTSVNIHLQQNHSGNISDVDTSVNIHQIILVLQTPFGLFIIIVNCIALIVLWKTEMAQNKLRVFFASMAVCDVSTGLLFIFNCIIFYYPHLLSHFTCAVRYGGLQWFIVVTLSNIAFLAIDRCCTLSFPYKYPYLIGQRHAVAISGSIWAFGLLTSFVAFWRVIPNLEECSITMGESEYKEAIAVIGIIYIITIIILIISYSVIIYHVKVQLRKIERDTCHIPRFDDQNNPRDIELSQDPAIQSSAPRPPLRRPNLRMRHLKTVTLVLGSVLICYLPTMALLTHLAFHPTAKQSPAFVIALNSSLFLLVVNSLVNPLLYTWKTRECRLTFLKLFCSCSKYCQTRIYTLRTENS